MMKNYILFVLIIIFTAIIIATQAEDRLGKANTASLSVKDPTVLTNPDGIMFPGLRGANQLIQYTPIYGKYTLTNEYGSEIIVINGIVVDKCGSNSLIPNDGYVLSGHGEAKKWLNNNTIIGSYITIDEKNKVVKSYTTPQSYIFGAESLINQAQKNIQCIKSEKVQIQEKKSLKYIAKAKDHINQAKSLLKFNSNDEAIKQSNLAFNQAEIAFYTSMPSVGTKEKGIWIRPKEKTQKEIKETIDKFVEIGINSIYLETFYHGYTIYPSSVAKGYGIKSQRPEFIDFDPLKSWVEVAHNKGIKVHCWIETFYVGAGTLEPVLSINPQWGNVQFAGINYKTLKPSTIEPNSYFLDPANSEASEYVQKIIYEIVKNYNIDGINLDYIRYPGSLPIFFPNFKDSTWGYTKLARAEFKSKYKIDPVDIILFSEDWQNWEKYRQEKVNLMVEQVYKNVKKINPKVVLSTVIFPELAEAQKLKMQNWQEWVTNKYVDILTPIILGSSPDEIYSLSHELKEKAGSEVKIYIGIFGMFNNDLPTTLLKQINSANKSGIDGINLFDAAHLNEKYSKALKMGSFRSN